MKWLLIGVAIAWLAIGCGPSVVDEDGSGTGIKVSELRVVAIDREGTCYVSQWSPGGYGHLGDFTRWGDCMAMFRDGWE